MTETNTAPRYFGREIAFDVYGSNMIFATRRDAEDFPCVTANLCDEVDAFEVFKRADNTDELIPALHEDVAENQPQHVGRNAKLFFVRVVAA